MADDAELALKIRKKGYKTVYSPAAIAYEVSPISLKSRIDQKSRRAQGHIRLIFQNLDVFLNPKLGKFGLIIFPANFFMMILSPWLILLTMVFGILYFGIVFGFPYALLLFVTVASLALVIYVRSTPKSLLVF